MYVCMYVVCMYPVSLRVCIYAHVRNGPPKVSRFPKGTKTLGTRLTSDKFWLNLATVENSLLPRYRSPAINGMPGCRARLYGNKSQFPNGLGRLHSMLLKQRPCGSTPSTPVSWLVPDCQVPHEFLQCHFPSRNFFTTERRIRRTVHAFYTLYLYLIW